MNIIHHRELLEEIKNHVSFLLSQEDYDFQTYIQELDAIVYKVTIISRDLIAKEEEE